MPPCALSARSKQAPMPTDSTRTHWSSADGSIDNRRVGFRRKSPSGIRKIRKTARGM